MPVGKASIMRAASAGAKKGSTAASDGKAAKQTVITPMNSEDLQVKFISGISEKTDENNRKPVLIGDTMPDYLL